MFAIQRAWIVLCAAGLIGGIAWGQPASKPAVKPATFDRDGIKFSYPGEWKRPEEVPPVMALMVFMDATEHVDGNMAEFVTLIVADVDPAEKPNLAAVAAGIVDSTRPTVQNLKVVANGPTTMGGDVARRLVLTMDNGDYKIKTIHVFSSRGGKLYTLSYSGDQAEFDKHLPAFEKVVQSVQWTAK